MNTDFRIGIIGGTGLAESFVDGLGAKHVKSLSLNTPFGKPSGKITSCTYQDVSIAMLQRHGDGHVFNPSTVPYRANIYALKSIGCTHIIASGATGSLRDDIHPGELVICDQIIDRTVRRDRTLYDCAAVHVEFADPFCPVMRQWLIQSSKRLTEITLHEKGCYVCMEGPAFSTRAESLMHQSWGGDVVGMTAVPEAKLAREAELAYVLIALPTDYDCWKERTDGNDAGSLLEEIKSNLKRSADASVRLIKAALENVTPLKMTPSPAHDALKLALWSEKSNIDRKEVERLRVLWGRYF